MDITDLYAPEGLTPNERLDYYDGLLCALMSQYEITPDNLILGWNLWVVREKVRREDDLLDSFLRSLESRVQFDRYDIHKITIPFAVNVVNGRGELPRDSILPKFHLSNFKEGRAIKFGMKMIEIANDVKKLDSLESMVCE